MFYRKIHWIRLLIICAVILDFTYIAIEFVVPPRIEFTTDRETVVKIDVNLRLRIKYSVC